MECKCIGTPAPCVRRERVRPSDIQGRSRNNLVTTIRSTTPQINNPSTTLEPQTGKNLNQHTPQIDTTHHQSLKNGEKMKNTWRKSQTSNAAGCWRLTETSDRFHGTMMRAVINLRQLRPTLWQLRPILGRSPPDFGHFRTHLPENRRD